MASTSGTAQSYNDLNVLGEVLMIGAGRNSGQFMAAIGGMAIERGGGNLGNGIRRVPDRVQFEMSATYSLDAGSQSALSENTTLTAGTPRFYGKSLEYNITQIQKEEIAVSNRRESSNNQLNTTSLSTGGNAPMVSEFDRQLMAAQKQIMVDWEYSALQGTFADRSAVGTAEKMRGVSTAITTSTVAAGTTALSRTHINNLLETMAGNGAPFERPAFVVPAGYVTAISDIYGFQPQAWDIGGVAIKNVMTDFGVFGVIWTNEAPANTLVAVDLAFCQPVVQPNMGQDILFREYTDGGSARKGYIEGFLSIDYGTEAYHGKITGLA